MKILSMENYNTDSLFKKVISLTTVLYLISLVLLSQY